MLNKLSCNAYGKAAHTLALQSAGSTFPLPASPMLCRCASRVVGGVSLPEVLHYAHRSPCSSPPFEHSPTSPNHELTTSELAVISLCDFRRAENLEQRKPKCAAETESAFRFIVTHWRFYRPMPCTFRSAQRRVSGSLRRAVGGCCHRDEREKIPFQTLIIGCGTVDWKADKSPHHRKFYTH